MRGCVGKMVEVLRGPYQPSPSSWRNSPGFCRTESVCCRRWIFFLAWHAGSDTVLALGQHAHAPLLGSLCTTWQMPPRTYCSLQVGESAVPQVAEEELGAPSFVRGTHLSMLVQNEPKQVSDFWFGNSFRTNHHMAKCG